MFPYDLAQFSSRQEGGWIQAILQTFKLQFVENFIEVTHYKKILGVEVQK